MIKNEKVKGNRSPSSCKSGNPIPQSGLEFRLLLSSSRWRGHGRDRKVSHGCSSRHRSEVTSAIHSESAVSTSWICPDLTPVFFELQNLFGILVKIWSVVHWGYRDIQYIKFSSIFSYCSLKTHQLWLHLLLPHLIYLGLTLLLASLTGFGAFKPIFIDKL